MLTVKCAIMFMPPDPGDLEMSPDGGASYDLENGLSAKPVFQLSMVDESKGEVVTSTFCDHDGVKILITELRAMLHAAEECTAAVDRGWQGYRDAVRRKAGVS